MKRHFVRIYIVWQILITGVGYAQPQVDLWREYDQGGTIVESFRDIYRYSRGGYLIAGESYASGWVLKLDEEGEIAWEVLTDSSIFSSVIEADNGDAVAGGGGKPYTTAFRAERINGQGELIWLRDYAVGHCSAVIEMKNGDFMLAGMSGHSGYITRIEGDGNPVWQNSYRIGGEEEYHVLYAMRETDGGVVVVGGYYPTRQPREGWIIKVNFDGEVLWSHRYGGGTYREFFAIVSNPGGGFAVGGKYNQNWPWGSSEAKFCLTIIDADGNVRNERIYQLAQGRGDICYGLNKLSDGFVLVGYTSSQEFTYPLALRINRSLDPIWSLDYSDNVEQRPAGRQPNTPTQFKAVVADEHGVITACGSFMSESEERGQDGLLVRLEPDVLGPQVFYYLPEDTVFTTLLNDEIDFIVRARTREGNELQHQWFFGEQALGTDTLQTIEFDSQGVITVTCRLRDADGEIQIHWRVTVADLYISSFTPDTLSLSLRRGTSQTFSIDTVRAVDGDLVQYQWTLTNLDNFDREETGTEASATIEFLRSGNYHMEGLAYRGESSDNVVWTVHVRSAILDYAPRSLHLNVATDSLVIFEVAPFNPESDSLSYRWEMDGDSVGCESLFAQRFAWDERRIGNPPHLVSAIVMDGIEGDTVRWEVTVREPEEVGKWSGGQVEKWGMLSVSPNPFNSMTTIRYSTSGDAYPTRLTVHDLTGREVARLVDSRAQQAGPYAVSWDASELPAGVYLIHLEAGEFHDIQKLVLLQ